MGMRDEIAVIRTDVSEMKSGISSVKTNVEWLVTEWRNRDCNRHLSRIERLEMWPAAILLVAKVLGGTGVVAGLIVGVIKIIQEAR